LAALGHPAGLTKPPWNNIYAIPAGFDALIQRVVAGRAALAGADARAQV